MENEIIICAAVKTRNNDIIRCHRHSDGLTALVRRNLPISGRIEGFITSTGRFVTRHEAYEIQIAANIPSKVPSGYSPGEELYSEDLY